MGRLGGQKFRAMRPEDRASILADKPDATDINIDCQQILVDGGRLDSQGSGTSARVTELRAWFDGNCFKIRGLDGNFTT